MSTWLTTIAAMHFQVQRLLGDLQAPAVKTRWESFNRQLSAFRLPYDYQLGPVAKGLSLSVSPLCRQHVLALFPALKAPRARRLRKFGMHLALVTSRKSNAEDLAYR
jgi:hypothetical protein